MDIRYSRGIVKQLHFKYANIKLYYIQNSLSLVHVVPDKEYCCCHFAMDRHGIVREDKG